MITFEQHCTLYAVSFFLLLMDEVAWFVIIKFNFCIRRFLTLITTCLVKHRAETIFENTSTSTRCLTSIILDRWPGNSRKLCTWKSKISFFFSLWIYTCIISVPSNFGISLSSFTNHFRSSLKNNSDDFRPRKKITYFLSMQDNCRCKITSSSAKLDMNSSQLLLLE